MASHEQGALLEQAALASGVEVEAEYESDSEDGTSALALRRRVASDVEDDDHEVSTEREGTFYDEDGEDDQGAPPDEDEDQDEEEEEEEEYVDSEDAGRTHDASDKDEIREKKFTQQRRVVEHVAGSSAARTENTKASGSKEGPEEDNQNAEPFVVPTSGAFYMHDDRFRNNGAIRARRSAGGRKLWEAKDEQRWVHDRFEELKLSEESYAPQVGRGRHGRGRDGRGQGRGRGSGRKGGRENTEETFRIPERHVRGRGRGLRRARMDDYEFREAKPARIRNDNRVLSTPKLAVLQPTGKAEEAVSKKPQTSSVLNSKSPPFFPTGTVTQNVTGGQATTSKSSEEKATDRDTTRSGGLINPRTSTDKGFTKGHPSSVTRSSSSPGNILSLVSDSGLGEVDRGLPRGSNNMKQQLPKTGSGSMLQLQQRPEGNVQHMLDQSSASSASQQSQQTARGTPSQQSQQTARGTPSQFLRLQQPQQQMQTITSGQVSRGQPMQAQSLVSPISLSVQPNVDTKGAPPPPANKLVTSAHQRPAQAATISAGRGSFMYGGSSLSNGLRSVVQFAGQPQANLGVPTVGVALPGYSSQPQFGFPNSEVTWIPILAGGGSLGSNYNNSYIAVDGSSPAVYYTPQASHSQQSTQTSTFPVLGRETNTSKTATVGSFNPPARSEADEFGQQRRRYSQMTFGEERR